VVAVSWVEPCYKGLPVDDLIGEARARVAALKRLCTDHEKLAEAHAKRLAEIARLESAVQALQGGGP
jgi:hypothetical protein